MDTSRWDPRCVLLAQCGDRAALEDLLTAIQEPLFRHVSRIVRNAALAEEALQETLLTICRKLRWLRDPELLRPWAYRIATRQALKVLRHERRWFAERLDESGGAGTVAAPPTEPPRDDVLPRLPELLDAASPLNRAVLSMHYLDELTLSEVAEALGVSIGTVKSRLSYGLAAIRRSMATQERGSGGGRTTEEGRR